MDPEFSRLNVDEYKSVTAALTTEQKGANTQSRMTFNEPDLLWKKLADDCDKDLENIELKVQEIAAVNATLTDLYANSEASRSSRLASNRSLV